MTMKRCINCQGSGRVLGGGMMHRDCEDCGGTGKTLDIKETDSYKNAINEIAEKTNISTDEATEIFDDEFKKLKDDHKSGRKKR